MAGRIGNRGGLTMIQRIGVIGAGQMGGGIAHVCALKGFHVKLTIHADGSQGADTKHKVFWVQPCEVPTTPPSTAPTSTVPTP